MIHILAAVYLKGVIHIFLHDPSVNATSQIRDSPTYHPSELRNDITRELSLNIPYKRAWQATEHARHVINGTDKESYQLLPRYCEQITKHNLNNFAIIEKTDEHKFHRLFVCYIASAGGFAYCRALIGLDGTHLTQIPRNSPHRNCS